MHHRARSMGNKPSRRWQQRAATAAERAARNCTTSGSPRYAVIPGYHRLPTGPQPRIDYRRDRLGGRTTLMRHALGAQPRPIATLSLDMPLPTPYAALVLLSGRLHTVAAGPPAALKAAIALATVTVRAQPERPLAPLTAHWPQPQHSYDRTGPMARNKSKHRREEKRFRRQQRDRQRQEQDNVVLDSAATLSCAAETAADFAGQCADQEEQLQFDLSFLNLALEVWGERPEPSTQPLLSALEELRQEHQRHLHALQSLGAQLQQLAEDPSLHNIHLGPIERYQQLVRDRLFSLTEPPEQ